MSDYNSELSLKLNKKTKELIKQMPNFASKFFGNLKHKNASSRTIQQYAYDMLRFFKWVENQAGFKNISIYSQTASEVLDTLTLEDIHEYLDTLDTYTYVDTYGKSVTKKAGASSKARKISSLRAFYTYYYKIGDIKHSMSDLIEVTKVPEKEIITLDKERTNRLFDAIDDISGMTPNELAKHNKLVLRDKAILMLLYGTGIRVSELCGIDIRDVDFFKYAQEDSQGSLKVIRKGGNEDVVYFGSDIKAALTNYINNCRDELLINPKEPALFISMQHKRITARSVEKLVKRYGEKAGLNVKVTPHTLRRSFGTSLYEASGDIYLVADSLGHSSVETTKKHYAKLSDEHKKLAVKYTKNLFNK